MSGAAESLAALWGMFAGGVVVGFGAAAALDKAARRPEPETVVWTPGGVRVASAMSGAARAAEAARLDALEQKLARMVDAAIRRPGAGEEDQPYGAAERRALVEGMTRDGLAARVDQARGFVTGVERDATADEIASLEQPFVLLRSALTGEEVAADPADMARAARAAMALLGAAEARGGRSRDDLAEYLAAAVYIVESCAARST